MFGFLAKAFTTIGSGFTKYLLLALAILSGAIYEREKGKREGEQIAAGKAAEATNKAVTEANNVQAEVQSKPEGSAASELESKWSR